MLKNAKHVRPMNVALLAALLALAGAARAEGGEYLLPVSFTHEANIEERDAEPVSCTSLREATWFLHEMEKTDGQVEPSAPTVRCAVGNYAESTADHGVYAESTVDYD